ncbi:ML domain-containing protein [Streptomyces anulatus]|nr:ML domain-containing protein [Streptomyces sp. or3]WTC75278.1 ML domain-containing protein [Streptomyces anulatus]
MTTWRYTDIGRDTDPLIINSITATPDAPQPGSPWKLAINATVLETIKEGAYLDVTVKLGLINLLQKRYDLFECLNGKHPEIPLTLDDKQVGPIEKGKVDMTLALNLKREVPPGQVQDPGRWLQRGGRRPVQHRRHSRLHDHLRVRRAGLELGGRRPAGPGRRPGPCSRLSPLRVTQRSEPAGHLGQQERVPAEHVHVVSDERGQARDVLVADVGMSSRTAVSAKG